MGRKKSRLLLFIKLSPLYLVSILLFYVIVFMDKELDYLSLAKDNYNTAQFDVALGYLNQGIQKKVYKGSNLVNAYILRAQTFSQLEGYDKALQDLDTAIELRPNSKLARKAASIKGEIFLYKDEYIKALKIYQDLILQTDDDEDHYDYNCSAGAAAHNYSMALLRDAKEILDKNLTEYKEELERINSYATDLYDDYELSFVIEILEHKVSDISRDRIIELAKEAQLYYRTAFDVFVKTQKDPYLNQTSSVFLANILYHSKRYLPAMLECSLALEEPLRSHHRKKFQEIMASILCDLKCYKKASDLYQSIRIEYIKEKQRPPLEVIWNLNSTRYYSGDYDTVIRECQMRYDNGARYPIELYCLGASYLKKNIKAEAIPILEELAELIRKGKTNASFNNSPARKNTIELLLQSYEEEESYLHALEILNSATLIFPDDLNFKKQKAFILDDKLNQWVKASKEYFQILFNGPRDEYILNKWIMTREKQFISMRKNSYKQRAKQLVDKLEFEEKNTILDKDHLKNLALVADFPEAINEAPLRLAISDEFLKRDRREEAISILRRIARANPEITEYSYRLGDIYFYEGKRELAVKEFERVLEKDQYDFDAIRKLITCYSDLNDYISEGSLVQKILQSNNKVMVQWVLANIKFKKKRYDGYLRIYDSIKNAPFNVKRDLDLMAAVCWIDSGDFNLAAAVIDPILKENPNNISALKAKADLLVSMISSEEKTTEPGKDEKDKTEPVKVEDSEAATDEGKKLAEAGPAKVEDAAAPVVEDERLAQAEKIVQRIKQLGPMLSKEDLLETVRIFVDKGQPDLAIMLVADIETLFPLTEEIKRELVNAWINKEDYKKASQALLEIAANEDDLKKAFFYGLFAGAPGAVSFDISQIIDKFSTDKELYLCAAAGSALEGNSINATAILKKANAIADLGGFSPYEIEFIDFLTRLLIQYRNLGCNVKGVLYPDKPLETEDVEEKEKAPTAESDDVPEKEVIPELETVENSSESIDPDTKDEEEKAPEMKLWTADMIDLGGKKLNERYTRIIPEAVYLVNAWRSDPEGNLHVLSNILTHLLLRNSIEFQDRCVEKAENVISLYPACGITAGYLLGLKSYIDDPQKSLALISPAIETIPDDYNSLSLMPILYSRIKDAEKREACLAKLEKMIPDPVRFRKIKAEVFFEEGAYRYAFQLFDEILKSKKTSNDTLISICPYLIRNKDTSRIIKAIDRLNSTNAVEVKLRNELIDYLSKFRSYNVDERKLAEKLIVFAPIGQRLQLITILSTIYSRNKEDALLILAAEDLLKVQTVEESDRIILGKALSTTAVGLIAINNYDLASQLLEYQYFLQPNDGEPLSMLAKIALEETKKYRRAAQYYELFHLLRPWETRNALKLAEIWFYKTGEMKKAYDLVMSSGAYIKTNIEMVLRIEMGYNFLTGQLEKAIEKSDEHRFTVEARSEEIIYLIACLKVLKKDFETALFMFQVMAQSFPETAHLGKCGYYIRKIESIFAAKEIKKAKVQQRPEGLRKPRKKQGNK